jgi:hypothetical protein
MIASTGTITQFAAAAGAAHNRGRSRTTAMIPQDPPLEHRPQLTAAAVKAKARALGFDLCGVAAADSFEELRFLHRWLELGYGGRMTYLNRTAARRADVRRVLPSARSVVVAAALYHVDRPYSTELIDRGEADGPRLLDAAGESGALRVEGVRGHGTGPGAGLRAARRDRLDWQEHVRDQS